MKMKSVLCVDFFICSIILIVALTGFSEAELEPGVNRRGGASGLVAFPRVGRSDPSMANNLHETDSAVFDNIYPVSLEEYDDYPKSEIKRASLIAFPRVGRNAGELRQWARLLALQQALDKRTGPSATSGLWFGPRLGKRSVDASEEKHETAGQKENY